jgi:hypothetical protein
LVLGLESASDSVVVQDSAPVRGSDLALATVTATVFEPVSALLSAVLSSASAASPGFLLQFPSPLACESCAHVPFVRA